MKDNILSIALGAIIMNLTGREIFSGLLFSFIGGFMGLVGTSFCKFLITKAQRLFMQCYIDWSRNRRRKQLKKSKKP